MRFWPPPLRRCFSIRVHGAWLEKVCLFLSDIGQFSDSAQPREPLPVLF
jgi:hypothetical protein